MVMNYKVGITFFFQVSGQSQIKTVMNKAIGYNLKVHLIKPGGWQSLSIEKDLPLYKSFPLSNLFTGYNFLFCTTNLQLWLKKEYQKIKKVVFSFFQIFLRQSSYLSIFLSCEYCHVVVATCSSTSRGINVLLCIIKLSLFTPQFILIY